MVTGNFHPRVSFIFSVACNHSKKLHQRLKSAHLGLRFTPEQNLTCNISHRKQWRNKERDNHYNHDASAVKEQFRKYQKQNIQKNVHILILHSNPNISQQPPLFLLPLSFATTTEWLWYQRLWYPWHNWGNLMDVKV